MVPSARAAGSRHGFGYALATSAPGQPGSWATLTKVRGHADQQAGHGPRLGIEGNLFSLLALQIRDLVYGEPRRPG